MGRPRKPDALKRAQGNPGKRALKDKASAEPTAAAADANQVRTPSYPPPFELKPQGLKIWNLLAADLSRMSYVRQQDRVSFARYCEYLGIWIDLNRKVSAGSIVAATKSKHVEMDRLDKRFSAMILVEKRMVDLEDRFGLNPRARQQIMAQLAGMGGAQHPGKGLFGEETQPAAPAQKPEADAETPPSPAASAPDDGGSPIGMLRH